MRTVLYCETVTRMRAQQIRVRHGCQELASLFEKFERCHIRLVWSFIRLR